jgi:chromosome segregation ATPase
MVEQYEKDKADLEREKGEILATQQAIDAERGGVQADAAQINDINARTEALSRRIAEWNERWDAFEKANRSGPLVERQRKRLLDEKREMEREEKELEAARGGFGGTGSGAAAVNAKVDALNARTVAWNQRNNGMVKRGEDLAQERDLWASECGSRRYREDDEIAIRNGQ